MSLNLSDVDRRINEFADRICEAMGTEKTLAGDFRAAKFPEPGEGDNKSGGEKSTPFKIIPGCLCKIVPHTFGTNIHGQKLQNNPDCPKCNPKEVERGEEIEKLQMECVTIFINETKSDKNLVSLLKSLKPLTDRIAELERDLDFQKTAASDIFDECQRQKTRAIEAEKQVETLQARLSE